MKTAVVTRPRYRNTGIETFESQVCPWLINNFNDIEKIHHKVREWYPLSITLEKLTYGRRLKKKVEGFDKVFIPAQERVLFNPESVDAEIIPYIHDIMPVTCMYKKYRNDSISARLSGYLSTMIATRYMKFIANCNQVIAASEHVAKELETRTAFDGEIHVVHQGVDDKKHASETKERDIDLVYVGDTKLERKNSEFIEKAVELAEAENFTTAAINFEETRLPVSQEFVDVSDEKVSEVLSRSRYYLHPSLMEGFGRGPVEAQLHGCIPLGLDTKINREILGEPGKSWGLVKEPRNVLPHLHVGCSDKRRKIARNNADQFKWDKCRRQIAEIITNQELVESRGESLGSSVAAKPSQ